MTRYEAFIEKSWLTTGLTQVLVARIRTDGRADIGFFIVDLWCLGIKDALFHEVTSEAAFQDLLAKLLPPEVCERLHPACAKKLLDGAIAYAEHLGFAPHRDYRKARKALSGLDAADCPETFTFGRDGQPCYVESPHDTPERTQRVLAMLKARCGRDGFDFELVDEATEATEATDDDTFAARELLIARLDAEPPHVLRFYELAGLAAALHVCRKPVSPFKLLDAIWPEGHEWADTKQAQLFAGCLTVYWNYVGGLVADVREPAAPDGVTLIDIWPEDFPQDTGLPLAAAMIEWARGFILATKLWPEAWEGANADPTFAREWEMIDWWAQFTTLRTMDLIAAAAEDTPPRTIASAVNTLARALRPTAPPPPVS